MSVYKAISAVSAELAQIGIGKGRKNQAQGYNFRGIDDVLQALAGLLAKHGLVIVPRVASMTRDQVVNSKGTTLLYTTATVEYDLVSVEDGSKHTACVIGEGMDSGDKSANKAMSAAYKYMALQTFCIPVEGVALDSEQDSHEVAAGLPDSVLADHLAAIDSAADTDALRAAYEAAINDAKAHADADAGKRINQAAKAAKTKLESKQ